MNPMIPCFKRYAMAMLAVTALFLGQPTPAQSADAANSVQSLDYSTLQGGKILVKVGMKAPLANSPAGFVLNNPPRIALDLPHTANALGKSNLQVGEGVLRNVAVVEAGGRTRLVFNLAQPVTYDTKFDGNDLLVTLSAANTSAATSTNATTKFAESRPTSGRHALRDVDFRRGEGASGRVVVDLSDNATGIDIRKQGKTLVVDFVNTAAPRNLERRLDVRDFGTPVQTIDTFTQGNNTRMVIEPQGQWEHAAYQTDRQFIVDVKPVVEDPNKLAQRGKYTGEKLSLNFQNVETRAVLQVIADFTGLNIITSDSVGGNLTLRLKDVPWDQALDIILQSKGLAMRKTGNVVLIAPTDELATKEKLELEAKQQISDLEPLQTESFQLKYQKAEAFQKILTDDKQKILSKRGSAVIDPRTNMLFIQDTVSKLEDIRRLIAQTDIPVRQVMIESRIVQATDTFAKNLGARLGLVDAVSKPNGTVGSGIRSNVGGSFETTGYLTGQIVDRPKVPQSLNVNLPAAVIGGAAPGSIAFTLFRAGARFLNLELEALQADGKGKVLSNPRLVTADQQEAVIEQGTEIPYLQASSSGATSISFKKAVLSLRVKPQITPDDNIIMDLKVNKDSRGTDTVAGPAIDTNQIQTQVLVENGGTAVIGGIYTQDEKVNVNKVPVLGDIPVFGALFRDKQSRDDKTELLIFVTPKILKDSLNVR